MDKTREQLIAEWKAAKAELDAVEAERDEIVKQATAHLQARLDAASEAEADAEEALDGIVIARCESCRDPILEGEPYTNSSDGDIHCCAKCSPTYAELQAHPETFMGPDEEPHTPESVAPFIEAHLASGGSLADSLAR